MSHSPLNGKTSDDGKDHKVGYRERISHFTWAWFECTMSTGAVAVVLSQQPNTFRGLETIGTIFFILDLVLFLTFLTLISIRFIIKPSAFTTSLHHHHESFYFGTFWVSIALILYCIQQYGVPSCGPWLVKTMEVLFWLYAAIALLVSIFQYHVIFDVEKLPVHDMMPAWILPIYPVIILGPLAGVILSTQPSSAGTPILMGAFAFQGLGWLFALQIYSLYITRLTSSDLPVESKRPGMYIAVGPAAYTSNTLVALGSQAGSILPPAYLGITSIPVGDVWKAIGVPAGIFLWLFSFWFFATSTVAVIHGSKKMHFTLSWWGFIFPNAGLTVAAIYIGNVLGSGGIKGVTSAMTIILVIAWIVVAVANIRAVWLGQILWPHHDEDMEDIEGHED